MRKSRSTANSARVRKLSRGTQRTTWVLAWTPAWPQGWLDQAWGSPGGAPAARGTLHQVGMSEATHMPSRPSSTTNSSLCMVTLIWGRCLATWAALHTWPRCSHLHTWEGCPCTAMAQTGVRKTLTVHRAVVIMVHATLGSCSVVLTSRGTVRRCSEHLVGTCLHKPDRAWICTRRTLLSYYLMLALASRGGTMAAGRDSSGRHRAIRRQPRQVLWVAGKAGSS
mmetsp:Transcript_22602/g.57712  ORF Transcript_22602/g.57712 Transcript_22602/m.57712 type:complete len:224 (+) Transcript_22602:1484-2155(+)